MSTNAILKGLSKDLSCKYPHDSAADSCSEDDSTEHERNRLLAELGDGDTGAREKTLDAECLQCLPGTRTSVLEEVECWASGLSSTRILWLGGVAGSGKSSIAASIASGHGGVTAAAVFYFSRVSRERNWLVLRSVSRQLTRWNGGVLERSLLHVVKTRPEIKNASFSVQFQDLLVTTLMDIPEESPPLLIVLDGLDEFDDHGAAARIVELVHQNHGRLPKVVKFILTGRNQPQLTRALTRPALRPIIRSIDLGAVEVDSDVKLFLAKHLHEIRDSSTELCEPLDWPSEDDLNTLVHISNRVFGHAARIVQYIGSPGHPQSRLEDVVARANSPIELQDLLG